MGQEQAKSVSLPIRVLPHRATEFVESADCVNCSPHSPLPIPGDVRNQSGYASKMMSPAFRLNDTKVDLADSDPRESLLRWLNRNGSRGTKEGCADGDCGACTVALIEHDARGQAHYRAVNSCLLPMGSLVGREIVTVEQLAQGEHLHPVQQVMVDCSGSQCGYCTPGFVMSLFAGYYSGELDDNTVEGNLCRCTGYLPIRRATDRLREMLRPADRFAARLASTPLAEAVDFGDSYFNPATIDAALLLKQQHSGAQWIAGATDLGVELSRGKHVTEVFIALDRIDELKRITIGADAITIGAGVSLAEIEPMLAAEIPALAQMLRWFAARQVKNRASIGGNLGTASPIGDLLPVLLALDGEIHLQSAVGRRAVAAGDFFIDYRLTARDDDELVVAVVIPRSRICSAAYKVAKRQSDDISIVAAVFAMDLDEHRRVRHVRLAYGGVAAIPLRAKHTDSFLLGRVLDAATLEEVADRLRNEFTPMSDHRASADYRRTLCANLFVRFIEEHFA